MYIPPPFNPLFFAGDTVDARAYRHQHPQGLWPVEGEVRRQGDQSFLGEVLIKVKIINATWQLNRAQFLSC